MGLTVNEKDIEDLEQRLVIALTDVKAKETLMSLISGGSAENTVWADSNATKEGDGSSSKPFKSLQTAIDQAQSKYGKFERKIVFVAANSAFDEDITVVGGLVTIMGLGAFTIGDAKGSAFSSTTPRNFTYQIDDAGSVDGKWPSIVIGTILDDETSSTHTAYLNACTISGDFLVTNPNALAGSKNIQLRNVKVNGNYNTSDAAPHGMQTYLRRCYFNNDFNSPSGLLNIVDSCQFDNLLNCAQYNWINKCEMRSGMTVTGAPLNSLPPNGIYGTNFKGVFTGPASSLLLDPVTNYFFNNNGASLAGGATKVLMHDETI